MKRFLAGFGRFWWDFVVGDDWRIAAGVALALAGGALLVAYSGASDGVIAIATALAIFAVAIGSILTARR
jgi:hypothetical protein